MVTSSDALARSRNNSILNRWIARLQRVVMASVLMHFQLLLPVYGDDFSVVPVQCENVILVTVDGLRVHEIFGGFDDSVLDSKEISKFDDFNAESPEARREKLLPFFWSQFAKHGIVLGDPGQNSNFMVKNPHHFSYPGYNELLTGIADPAVDSNAKRPNDNITVLEWLNQKPEFAGKVVAFTSWDVFPYIINSKRSGIPVNSGWMPLAETIRTPATETADRIAREIPHTFDSVRYDTFTLLGALECLRVQKPRVLYVALGEPDDWAHKGDYRRYLNTSYQFDQSLKALWEAVQNDPHYAGKTAFVISSDHGRGDTREGWKNHSKTIPGSDRTWALLVGQGLPASFAVAGEFTQGQIASTVAALLGYDFTAASPKSAKSLVPVAGK